MAHEIWVNITYINELKSLFMSHGTNIQGMTFDYQIVFEILGIINGP